MASWVQAFFSVIAIIGSAWVANDLFSKEKGHEAMLREQEVLIKSVAVVSNLIDFSELINKLLEKRKKMTVLNVQVLNDDISYIINKSPLPERDYIEKTIYADPELAKSLAIAAESVRQLINNLNFYMDVYKKDNYILPPEKNEKVIELITYISCNSNFAVVRLIDFLESYNVRVMDKKIN